jgi:hypothetical protein
LYLKAPNGPEKGRKEAEKEVENLEVGALTAKVAVLPTGILSREFWLEFLGIPDSMLWHGQSHI